MKVAQAGQTHTKRDPIGGMNKDLLAKLAQDGLVINEPASEGIDSIPLMKPDRMTRRRFTHIAAAVMAGIGLPAAVKAQVPDDQPYIEGQYSAHRTTRYGKRVETFRHYTIQKGQVFIIENNGDEHISLPVDTKTEVHNRGAIERESRYGHIVDGKRVERRIMRVSLSRSRGIETTLNATLDDHDPTTPNPEYLPGEFIKVKPGDTVTFKKTYTGREKDILYLPPGYRAVLKTPGSLTLNGNMDQINVTQVDGAKAERLMMNAEQKKRAMLQAEIKKRMTALKPGLDKMNSDQPQADKIGGYGRFGIKLVPDMETGAITIEGLEANHVHERKVRVAPVGRYMPDEEKPISSTLVLEVQTGPDSWEKAPHPDTPGFPKIGASVLSWMIRESKIEGESPSQSQFRMRRPPGSSRSAY